MKVFLVAGEPSGDRLGAALMRGLVSIEPDVTFAGVGGPGMEGQGLRSLFEYSELSVMGLSEVLPRYPALHARMRETAARAVEEAPDVIVTIDSPDFCLRVLKRVRKSAPDIRTVHYVAPTVWAWRPGRARRMAAMVDQVLTLLPFEPPYMEAEGMRADFVGHPVVAEEQPSDANVAAFRTEHGLGDAPVLLVLPGSRHSEVSRLLEPFKETAAAVIAERPDVRVVVPAAPTVADRVSNAVQSWAGQPVVINPGNSFANDPELAKRCAFRAADVALAASGTVSLELAAAETPMVIAYDASWLSRTIISAMLHVDTVTLVNLVSATRAVPEFIGPRCRPDLIAPAVLDLLKRPDGQRDALRITMERLGRGGKAPGTRAARAVFDGLGSGTAS